MIQVRPLPLDLHELAAGEQVIHQVQIPDFAFSRAMHRLFEQFGLVDNGPAAGNGRQLGLF
jgi:hypothetical protein